MATIDRLTFMLAYADKARADVTLTADHCYYRFMTEDSLEDGELPGLREHFDEFSTRLCDVFSPGVGASHDIGPVRFTLFVNNSRVEPVVLNNDTLALFAETLASEYDEMSFLRAIIG